jgi:hypothetical protein
MKAFLSIILLAVSCGPQPEFTDSIGKQSNFARKHLSDRGFTSDNISRKVSTADDVSGAEANRARKQLSEDGISSEQLEDLGVMTAEDSREYLYTRGVQEMRHGNQNRDGADGASGKDGARGADGVNGEVGQQGISGNDGATGPQGDIGATGAAGDKGDVGEQGPAGEVGATGAKGDKGEVGSTGPQGEQGVAGEKGDQGENGQDAIIEVIDPCGDKNNSVDEVLFRLATGEIAAWYKDVGLVVLEKNVKYVTTDSQACKFKINNNGQVVGW